MISKVIASLLLVLLGLVAAQENIVQTDNGPVQGILSENYRAFLGIPYAAPPVGDLRWAATEARAPWSGTWDATEFSAGCPQSCHLPPHTCPETTSEDCLYLNVWTPRMKDLTNKKPVMLWLPGGRFEQGEAGSLLYNGAGFMNISTDMILVSTNYRLGALGFLTTGSVQGNFGFQDQLMAMRWVQNNIAAFGGDPNQVTLAGQSAGATSVACHLISPFSEGLFHRAIIESNPFTLVMKTEEVAQNMGAEFLGLAGCDDGDWQCLRSLDIQTILYSQNATQKTIPYFHPLQLFLPWTPVVDGDIIPEEPFGAIVNGNFHKVPIILGTVRDDALLFVYQAAKNYVTEAEYLAVITWVFGLTGPDVLEYYPPHNIFHKNDSRPVLSKLGTDYVLACSTRNVALAVAQQNVDVYLYEFDHVLSFDPWGSEYAFCNGVVCHGAELPFVFNSVAPFDQFTPDELQLSENIQNYWTNFVVTGNPNNGANAPSVEWPVYNSTEMSISLAIPLAQVQGLRKEYCDFWDQEGYDHGF